MRGVVGEGKYNSLTLISYIRSKEISLQAVSQTAKPPALIVFVQDLDDVATANGELIRPVSVVVIEGNNLKLRRNEGGVRGVGHGHVSYRSVQQHPTGSTARARTHQWLSRGRVCLQTDAWGNAVRGKALRGKDRYIYRPVVQCICQGLNAVAVRPEDRQETFTTLTDCNLRDEARLTGWLSGMNPPVMTAKSINGTAWAWKNPAV